jgi:hypothetical protein
VWSAVLVGHARARRPPVDPEPSTRLKTRTSYGPWATSRLTGIYQNMEARRACLRRRGTAGRGQAGSAAPKCPTRGQNHHLILGIRMITGQAATEENESGI